MKTTIKGKTLTAEFEGNETLIGYKQKNVDHTSNKLSFNPLGIAIIEMKIYNKDHDKTK